QALQRGEYFWADIVRDGIVLYELPGHPLATPKPLTKFDAVRQAERYFDEWFPAAQRFLATAREWTQRAETEIGWRKDAAFILHQAAERTFACFLLTVSFYFPRSHNIKFLRSISEAKEPKLIEAWPRDTKLDRRRFELLKRAYVEARYSANYHISIEDLDALCNAVKRLQDFVDLACRARIEQLGRG
ncbi:HEPN domain-containing protein, partial [Novosphingobium sp. PS1R-30]